MTKNQVCLFFYVRGKFLIHGCDLNKAERYGDFLTYPKSHFDVWDHCYYEKVGVDFDFFPRGRVTYNKKEDKYLIYYDSCIGDAIHEFMEAYYDVSLSVGRDEHYQCHKCNKSYVI